MRVGLFIPCYIDQLYPRVGMATVEVLEQAGVTVEFPEEQTCCGQPMANTGCTEETRPLAERFLKTFGEYDAIVCPSGSCTAMVTHHYEDYLSGHEGFEELKAKTYELTEFLLDVLKIEPPSHSFPFRVGVHNSCHGLRELRLGSCTEHVGETFSKLEALLVNMQGISFAELTRRDECCGFGGTFSVAEEGVSCMMGRDRLADHAQAQTEVLTAGDMSCLMHLTGLARRDGSQLPVMHIAEILAGYQPASGA